MELLEGLGINWKMLLGQIVNFLVILYLLKRFVYKPFLQVLKERKSKIENGLKFAEEADEKSKKAEIEKNQILKEAWNKASETIKEGEKKGVLKTQEIIGQAQKEKERILKEAENQAKMEIEEMKQGQRGQMINLSMELAERILKEKIDQKKDKKLIENFLLDIEKNEN